jgi:hypothetical protein
MIPTENEYTLATHAAAKLLYAQMVARVSEGYPDAPETPWEELSPSSKRPYLERVLPIVDVAISAIPDRLDDIRILADTVMTDAEFRRAVVKLVEK